MVAIEELDDVEPWIRSWDDWMGTRGAFYRGKAVDQLQMHLRGASGFSADSPFSPGPSSPEQANGFLTMASEGMYRIVTVCFDHEGNEIADRSSIEDVDAEVMARYKADIGTDLPDEQVLRSRGFLVDGHLTNAGVLIFAENPTRFIPCARVRVIRFDGNKMGTGRGLNIVKERTFDGPLPKVIEGAKAMISEQLREFQYLGDDGRELAKIRREAGFTQVEVAKALGVSSSSISDVENMHEPRRELAKKYAAWIEQGMPIDVS